MKFPSAVLFFGKTNSGKTNYAVNLVYHALKAKQFDYIYCVCPTNFSHKSWDFIEERWRTHEYDPKAIEELLKKQKEYHEAGTPRKLLLILDDCIEYFNPNDPLWKKIASSARHYGVSSFIFFQHYFACPKIIRKNASYHFHFIPASEEVAKEYIKEFSLRGNVDDIVDLFDREVRDFNCVLYDNTKNSNKVGEVFFVSKSKKGIPKFVFKCTVSPVNSDDEDSDSDCDCEECAGN